MAYLLHSVIYLSIGAVTEKFDLVMSSSWKIPARAKPNRAGGFQFLSGNRAELIGKRRNENNFAALPCVKNSFIILVMVKLNFFWP